MNLENRLWQILLVLVGLLTVFVPAYVAYDIYGRGTLPKKRIELDVQPSINVMRDLSGLRENAALSLRIQGEPTDNLIVVKAFLKNIGETPILPPEFYENISVNVKKPWRILAVGNSKELNSDIQFSWKRVNDLRFEAEPALLNPGDRVATTIYLTSSELQETLPLDKSPDPKVEWKTRIINLSSFVPAIKPFERIARYSFGFLVFLSGWSLVFTIGGAVIFQAAYIWLLSMAGFVQGIRFTAVVLLLAASVLSFAAAESMSTYLFGNLVTEITGMDHWSNLPWIIIHVGVLFFLYMRAKRKKSLSQDLQQKATNQ